MTKAKYIYADTSALAKKFWREDGTETVLEVLSGVEAVAIAEIGYAEFLAATFRALRRGDVRQEDVPVVLRALKNEWNDLVRIPVDEGLILDAAALVGKYPLRAYDAVHLAAALRWRFLVGENILFLAFDKELLRSANAEGLLVPMWG